MTIWTVAYVEASATPCIVLAYGGFWVVVVVSMPDSGHIFVVWRSSSVVSVVVVYLFVVDV